jgi:hypothetical protein
MVSEDKQHRVIDLAPQRDDQHRWHRKRHRTSRPRHGLPSRFLLVSVLLISGSSLEKEQKASQMVWRERLPSSRGRGALFYSFLIAPWRSEQARCHPNRAILGPSPTSCSMRRRGHRQTVQTSFCRNGCLFVVEVHRALRASAEGGRSAGNESAPTAIPQGCLQSGRRGEQSQPSRCSIPPSPRLRLHWVDDSSPRKNRYLLCELSLRCTPWPRSPRSHLLLAAPGGGAVVGLTAL